MPKTKIISKKKNLKAKKAFNWLKPTTPLKRMVLFALVFAIAGGTYYAYKTHAASWTQYASSFTNYNGGGDSGSKIETDGHGTNTKGTVSVLKMNGALWISPLETRTSSFESRIYVGADKPRFVQYCASARSPITSPNAHAVGAVFVTDDNGTALTGASTYSIAQSTTYAPICSNAFTLPAGSLFVKFHLINGYNNGTSSASQLYVFSVSMNW